MAVEQDGSDAVGMVGAGVKSVEAYEWMRDVLDGGKVGGVADNKEGKMNEGW